MISFKRWQELGIVAACLLSLLLSIPSLTDVDRIEYLPNWLRPPQISLGLDLRGGSHILFQIDGNAMFQEQISGAADTLRSDLRRVGVKGAEVRQAGDKIIVYLKEEDDRNLNLIFSTLRELGSDFSITTEANDQVVLVMTQQAVQQRKQSAIRQSIEIIRRRIDESGTKEPTIQAEGVDRILVQLPGITDPGRVKQLIGATAKLSFRLVDREASPDRPPAGTETLNVERPGPGESTRYVVQKRIMVSGDSLTDAQQTFNNDNRPAVAFRFNTTGARRFGETTSENVGKLFAIVLDNKIISAPVIREAITGGKGIISGNFTAQSAADLALLLRAGALPAPLTVVEERTVGPDLGVDSIKAGTIASIVAIIAVVLFMLMLYGLFGAFANIALLFNLFMLIASLNILQATLTLPGIAGIALTMGMAVDANVLIYERIREERRLGMSVIAAIDAGFRRALGTILDSHITTLIASAVLFQLGSGPVRGFAVTMAIGVLTSLFTALLVTRLIISYWLRIKRPKTLPVATGIFGLFAFKDSLRIPFVRLHKIGFFLALVMTVTSSAMILTRGLNFGIDFSGGVLIEAKSNEPAVDLATLRANVNGLALGEVSLQQFGSPNDILVRLPHQKGGEAASQTVVDKVRTALGTSFEIRRVEVVGPKVGGELITSSIVATLIAVALIATYVAFRFEWQFGIGAMVAIVHGAITTVGLFSLTHLEFNLTTFAAILTVAGYSINDTVVVFDRIRENLRKYKAMPLDELINMSLKETLSRTVLTAGSVVLAVLSLLIFGGEVLRGLSVAMLWGIVICTLSSLFIAAPLLLYISPKRGVYAHQASLR